jgi:PAS domain S-box-containing protein
MPANTRAASGAGGQARAPEGGRAVVTVEAGRLFDAVPDALLIANRSGEIVHVNVGAEEMFGYPRDELLGRPVETLVPERLRAAHHEHRHDYFAVPTVRPMGIGLELTGRRKDGTEFPVEIHLCPIELNAHAMVLAAVRNVTARKQLERRVAELRERERQRLGRELHDTLGQQLAGVSMMASALRRRLTLDRAQADLADRLEAGIDEAGRQLRQLIRGVFPVDVDAHGLRVALEQLARETCTVHEIQCVFECPEPVPLEDNFTATQLFLIAREAVYNAVTHGRARRIVIRLASDGGVRLIVRDDGIGIGAGVAAGTGMGLGIMHERARLISGRLAVGATEGGGTVVTCALRDPGRGELSGS